MGRGGYQNAGVVNDTPVISLDLTATILDAACVSLPQGKRPDGESLRPLLISAKPRRDALFFHYPHFAFHKANRPGSAIRQGRHKLILRYDDDSTELYDVVEDISETKDLTQAQPDLTRQLKSHLIRWLQETKAGLPRPSDSVKSNE